MKFSTIIFGNYGDNTIALIQWAQQQSLGQMVVAHVDAGWAAPIWADQVAQGQALAQRYGFATKTLTPPASFAEAVMDRGHFPSQKFQWCAGFLKGLAFLNWADEIDPSCETSVLLGSRRADSRARADLPELIESSEHFGGREIRYPLCYYSNDQRDQLIAASGLPVLGQRSLECATCIHSDSSELQRLDPDSIARQAQLEQQIGQTMFKPEQFGGQQGIHAQAAFARAQPAAKPSLECFDMGCGSIYACGE